ncbi:MAG: hypothetical protein A3A58_02700 [Candidatus Blackburnbacteria bacterium RIFCSPLOWO2_01_FULL_41_27]|uniref:CMP/dCMP-type deaminase domain-containing protein n=2 Tax=Candidatus Blackburniibacteriota TaxID=1817898 RepID=A0A1G1VAH0_9BACT|nr:MAG: hypothetical protein A3H79_01860 [Candidatus Levybacteria bacterium RIFCSPLOWO2_02_FULL_36_8b]OGY12389.1 MAG: hypothetical protein A3F61_03770 [Candidatus Blackburnbacteria bacterium RIFCSPHIGHO2_12_FULL_41_13b]OGY14400.1 MAG: hypothetical protein A3A58_02700 [Candidatus Blackburnbacteria bacterium RIFCSPLOWO2_01_FULL_41_27]
MVERKTDIDYLKLAIDNSRKSFEEGNFPAGAVVVVNGEVVSSEVSSPYPGLLHADSKAVQAAFNKLDLMPEATLYCSMQSCLMCTSVAYWGGIRRIVFAVRKEQVDPHYYETRENTDSVVDSYHEKIERIHVPELEAEALAVVREWEAKQGVKA